MPVVVRVVSDEEYASWKKQLAAAQSDSRLASTASGAQ
jgi:cytochrome c oxidase subunit 2